MDFMAIKGPRRQVNGSGLRGYLLKMACAGLFKREGRGKSGIIVKNARKDDFSQKTALSWKGWSFLLSYS
jgi:hypothetical protein